MISEMEALLQTEINVGERHQRTWDELVEPFFKEKQADLYTAFRMCEVGDSVRMKEILHQSKALDSLRDQFEHFINTGTLAKQNLSEMEGE